jgi:hypothetical protein
LEVLCFIYRCQKFEVVVVVTLFAAMSVALAFTGNLGNAFWHTTSVIGLGPPRFRGILLDDK